MISFRAASRGWGYNVSPTVSEITRRSAVASVDDEVEREQASTVATVDDTADAADETGPEEPANGAGGHAGSDDVVGSPRRAWRMHPIGWVAGGVLVVALLYHSVLDTKYLIGNLEAWHWLVLVAALGLSAWPAGLHGLRLGLDGISSVTKRISMTLAWVVFFVQFFNVVTRYGTRYVDQDILIGEATSLAWQSFAALFLLGANYGIRDGVNPRIDFWWANFSEKFKAWLDFVLHALIFLPFVFVAVRILQPYAAISLGRKRDGTWPSGFRVWETWEQSNDADQLPVGPVKTLLLVGFVLIGLQIISEMIKTGFIMANRRHYGDLKTSDAPQRIE